MKKELVKCKIGIINCCISACFFALLSFGCASNTVNISSESQPKQAYEPATTNEKPLLQENGLAFLNIKEPVKLTPYPTNHTGDGVFHNASYIAKDMKLGFNIGNTMEAYEAGNCEKITYTWIPTVGRNRPADYETCWGSPVITQEMVDGIKAAGFNTVRIPVFWGNMMKNDGQWIINPQYLARVREIVDYCLNDDLYVVVNCHHFDEFIIRRNNLEDASKIIANIWSQIASYFEQYSEKLIFEGFNEYLGGDQFNSSGYLTKLEKDKAYLLTNTLNQSFVNAVRSTGGKNLQRVLIISGYWTNIDLTTSKEFKVPEDSAENKLMVSVHYVDNSMYWQNKIGGKTWIEYIDNQCQLLENAFTSKGIPVFLGETTAAYPSTNIIRIADYKTSPECLEYVLKKLLDCGFVPVLWDTHSTHSFYMRKEARIRTQENADVISRMKAYAELR
ncbi:MAG: glycoside hydrolase family 5 protein [Treponema sp.]|nr:glycoside hydrolase family 5 protein [Treponema sp.]